MTNKLHKLQKNLRIVKKGGDLYNLRNIMRGQIYSDQDLIRY